MSMKSIKIDVKKKHNYPSTIQNVFTLAGIRKYTYNYASYSVEVYTNPRESPGVSPPLMKARAPSFF